MGGYGGGRKGDGGRGRGAEGTRRVLITGASSGLGRALALDYADHGYSVGALARRGDLLNTLVELHPEHITAITADTTDFEALEQAIHRFNIEEGGLDLVYANAGIGQHAVEEGWNPEKARRIAEVNVVGSTNTIAVAATIMVAQGHGRIVGISSLAGELPLPSSAAYGASKSWMKFYLQSLDMDLRDAGVRCTVVMPGYIATPMVDGAESELVTEGAKRAARLIAERVARGDALIRFPRRAAFLASVAKMMPASWRIGMQRKRLRKRKTIRGGREL